MATEYLERLIDAFRETEVVKLPKERVEALIGAKLGEYFDPGHGRLMKEWGAIQSKAEAQWLKLAKAAQKFMLSRIRNLA